MSATICEGAEEILRARQVPPGQSTPAERSPHREKLHDDMGAREWGAPVIIESRSQWSGEAVRKANAMS